MIMIKPQGIPRVRTCETYFVAQLLSSKHDKASLDYDTKKVAKNGIRISRQVMQQKVINQLL